MKATKGALKSMTKTATITAYAEELLQQVHFVNVHGHKVGLDFHKIILLVKRRFPKCSMSIASLRYIKCKMTVPLPKHPRVREGSRRRAAHEYTRSLLMRRDANGNGLTFETIRTLVWRSFPKELRLSLPYLEIKLKSMYPHRMPTTRVKS